MVKQAIIVVSFLALACGTSTFASPQVTRTPLPTLTPTPNFNRWTAVEVMRAINQAGLENGNPHFMSPHEYGVLPAPAAEGIRFSVASVCPDCEGMILSFNDPVALDAVKNFYLKASAQDTPQLSAWLFEKDNILLQLNGQLPEAQALRYGTVLIQLDR